MTEQPYNLTAAKFWYGISFSASAVVYPFLMVYFQLCGFSKSQVGVLFAVRPWLTVFMGNAWAGIADHMHIHKIIFLLCYVVASLFRFSISLTAFFPVSLAICVATELFAPPVMILMDAATMAASAKVDGGYGRVRMWGAVGWGGMSPIGGWVVSTYGFHAGFYGYLIFVALGLIPGLLAPVQVLSHRSKAAQEARQAALQGHKQRPQALPRRHLPSDHTTEHAAASPGVRSGSGAAASEEGKEHVAELPYPIFLASDLADKSLVRPAAANESAAPEVGGKLADEPSAALCNGVAEGRVTPWPDASATVFDDSPGAAKAQQAAEALGLSGSADGSRAAVGQLKRHEQGLSDGAPDTASSFRAGQHNHAQNGHHHRAPGAGDAVACNGRHSQDDERPGEINPHLAMMWAALEQWPLASEPVLQAYNPSALQTPARRHSVGRLSADLAVCHDHRRLSADGQHTPRPEPAILHAPAGDSAADHLNAFQRVYAVVSRAEVATFLLMAVMFGYGMGTIDSFMFIYLRELGGSEFLMGLCIFTMCATEAPLFHFAGHIFDYVGLARTLHIVMGVYIFRLCAYGFLELAGSPWAVLPIEVLHGITFGCAWAAGTLNCSRIAPHGLEATTQAIFNGLYMGVGLGLGGVVGGIIYDRFGARVVFFSAAAVIACGWLLVCVAQQLLMYRKRTASERGEGLQEPLLTA